MQKYSIAILFVAVLGLVIMAAAAIHGLGVVAAPPSAKRPQSGAAASNGNAAGAAGANANAAAAHGPVVRFASNAIPAPPFLLPDLNGNMISTAEWHDRVVLLNFWATWCEPCREEVPELIDLANRYKDKLQIVSVSMDDSSPEEVKLFAQRFGINYSVVMSSNELVGEYGGVPALPTNFIISPLGRVVQKHVGLYPEEVFDTEIRVLLGLPVNATVTTFVDTGQIFLKNASLATELPGVDLSGLDETHKKAVLKRLNAQGCDCGCRLTLAQCRMNDTSCPISKKEAAEIVKMALEAEHATAGQPTPD